MMKIITCYLTPSKGDVRVNGYNIYDESIKVRRAVGYLPETNPLYPEMYIREYLLFVAGMYRIKNKKARVEEMIEIVGLTPESHKHISSLSKGYRQRVGLAQAMIHDPEVLILDEPTSGLDPNQLEDIRALIKKIGAEKTVLISTHIMQEVEAICNRVIIIKKGELVADSPVALLKNDTELDIILLYLNKDIEQEAITKLVGVQKVQREKVGSYRIHAKKGSGVLPKLNALATLENAEVFELRKEERSLEDVFKALTK